MKQLKLVTMAILFTIGWWLVHVLYALDQLANTVIGGRPDKTLSHRMGIKRENCVLCRVVCWLLDKVDKNHCDKAVKEDGGNITLRQRVVGELKERQLL